MPYELKKIFNEFYVKLLFVGIILISLVIGFVTIKSFGAIESIDSAKELQGKAAIELLKSQYKNSKGELSVDKINQALKYYKSFPSQDNAYVKTEGKYPGVLFLLMSAYSTTGGNANLYNLKNANDFYKKNITQIEKKIAKNPDEYGDGEKDIIIQKATSIKTPYSLDFNAQWKRGYIALTMLFIVMGVAGILVGSRLFSYEKENNMEIILTTLGKYKLYGIARKKIVSLWTFITMLCFLSVSVFSIYYFSIAGLSSWNSQIQTGYFTSISHLTFGEAYIALVFIGWISLLSIGTLVALLNAYIQKSLASLTLGVIVVFVPWLLCKLEAFPLLIKKFCSLQPFNGIFTENTLLSLRIYKFVLFDVSTMVAILINSFCILAICYLASPKIFGLRITKH